jgi:hypothetical protein
VCVMYRYCAVPVSMSLLSSLSRLRIYTCSRSALSPSDFHSTIIYASVTSVPNNICPTIWSLPLFAITSYNTRHTPLHHLGSNSHDPINHHHNRPTIPIPNN